MVAVQANTDYTGMRADNNRYCFGANLDTPTGSVARCTATGVQVCTNEVPVAIRDIPRRPRSPYPILSNILDLRRRQSMCLERRNHGVSRFLWIVREQHEI